MVSWLYIFKKSLCSQVEDKDFSPQSSVPRIALPIDPTWKWKPQKTVNTVVSLMLEFFRLHVLLSLVMIIYH